MCQLLAFAFEEKIKLADFEDYYDLFIANSVKHKDGWGIAYFENLIRTVAYRSDGFRTVNSFKKITIIKEPQTALTSEKLKKLDKKLIESNIILAHIRMASCGDNCEVNTHPFSYTLESGNDIIFMHNGNLEKDKIPITIAGPQPYGQTDSEHAFIYLLQNSNSIFQKTNLTKEDFESLKNTLEKIHELGNGPFNCIFSNGQYIFAYRDKNGKRNLNFLNHNGKKGIIVSTQVLGEDKKLGEWKEFEKGKLMAIENGRIVYYG